MLSIMIKKKPELERSYVQDLRDACFRYRADRRLTQEGMGKLLGVSRGAVGNFEKGRTFLGEAAIDKLVELTQDEALYMARALRNLADFLLTENVPIDSRLRETFRHIQSLNELLREVGSSQK